MLNGVLWTLGTGAQWRELPPEHGPYQTVLDLTSLKGKPDRALLTVLLGCRLRRAELVALTLEHLQQREGRWVLLDLAGKGRRLRTVPMPA